MNDDKAPAAPAPSVEAVLHEKPPLPGQLPVTEKDRGMVMVRGGEVQTLQTLDVAEIEAILQQREQALDTLRRVAIRQTKPADWTLYKDREGHEIAVPRDSGLVVVRKWLGISVGNYRPKNRHGVAEPMISEEMKTGEENKQVKVWVAEMFADGVCSLTGERIHDVYFATRSDQGFTGRTINNVRGGIPTPQDLKASCRTGLDNKVTRLLAGLRKVTVEQLQENGVKTEHCYKGSGYGNATDRTAAGVTEEGVASEQEKLWNELLRLTGGDIEAAKSLCKDITKGDKPNAQGRVFGGFETPQRITQQWAIDKAWTNLRQHPVFGTGTAPA